MRRSISPKKSFWSICRTIIEVFVALLAVAGLFNYVSELLMGRHAICGISYDYFDMWEVRFVGGVFVVVVCVMAWDRFHKLRTVKFSLRTYLILACAAGAMIPAFLGESTELAFLRCVAASSIALMIWIIGECYRRRSN
jgi:hypothetical protein